MSPSSPTLKHRWKFPAFIIGLALATSLVDARTRIRCNPCRCFRGSFDELPEQELWIMNCSSMIQEGYIPYLPSEIEVLDLSYNSLDEIYLAGDNIKALILRDNNLTSIPQLPDINKLIHLDLLENPLDLASSKFSGSMLNIQNLKLEVGEALDENIFQDMTSLEKLYVRSSHDSFPENLFATGVANTLRHLTLDVPVVSPKVFEPLQLINEVHLHLPPSVTSLPDDLFTGNIENTLSTLVIKAPNLIIKNRNLLKRLESLQKVELWLENAKTLPVDVFYPKNTASSGSISIRHFLSSITIVGVETIPREIFKHINRLRYLEILHSEELPSDLLTDVRRLKTLKLPQNNLTSIPVKFLENQERLRELDMSSNYLKIIKEEDFGNLENIVDINLSHNNIHRIDEPAFQYKTDLLNLDLSHNNICHIGKDTFDGLVSLKSLHLQFNCLDNLDASLFENLSGLTNLYLQVNNISEIPNGLFDDLEQLEVLDLNENQIRGLTSETLEKLFEIQTVTMDKNQIESLPSFELPPNPNLEYFLVGSLNCDCGVVHLLDIKKVVGICAKPNHLAGQKLARLVPDEICLPTTVEEHYVEMTTFQPNSDIKVPEVPCRTDSCDEYVEIVTVELQPCKTGSPCMEDETTTVNSEDHPANTETSTSEIDIPWHITPPVKGGDLSTIRYDTSEAITNELTEATTNLISEGIPEITKDVSMPYPTSPAYTELFESTKTRTTVTIKSVSSKDISEVTKVPSKLPELTEDSSEDISYSVTIEYNKTIVLNVGEREGRVHLQRGRIAWLTILVALGMITLLALAVFIRKSRGKLYEREYIVNWT